MSQPVLTLIWAMASNGVIGHDGDLPWHLPDELRRFKAKTIGGSVIMGRSTWESLPSRPLVDRQNIVMTRNPDYVAAGAVTAGSLEDAIELVDSDTAFVIGGASVFETAVGYADRLEVTVVHATVEGDTVMPPIDWTEWSLVGEEHHPADERHEHAFTFETYERVD